MLTFLIKHSLVFMFLAAIVGFLFPDASLTLFLYLPYILFSLMLLTLLSMQQSVLLTRLLTWQVALYAVFHAFGLMIVSGLFAWMISADQALFLAIIAVAATGSLFATPAIVRALGLDALLAMAMTIASTLVLPVAIYLTLIVFGTGEVALDLRAYAMRLVIFIFGPMFLSFLVHRFVSPSILAKTLMRISPYTILLVFAFPFGLISSFRLMWDENPALAYQYFAIAVFLCGLFFVTGLLLYLRQGRDMALMAAITSGNRNVLLTYTIAGSLLGPAFLPLAGALQAPTYLLPVLTRWLAKKMAQTKSSSPREH